MWDFNKKEQYIIGLLLLILFFLGGGIIYRYSQGAKAEPPTVEKATASSASDKVVVHIAGEVVKPGVYRLSNGERVIDAVKKAGGPTKDSDLDKLNLAAPLEDGQKILVPASLPLNGQGSPVAATEISPLVNLNTADEQELDKLPGIGPALAQRILSYRQEQGSFTAVEDLRKVSGIGEKKFLQIKDLVTVN